MKAKRFLGILLVLVIIIGIVPITASANENNALYGTTPDNINTAGNFSDIISEESDTLYIKLTSNVALEKDFDIGAKAVNIDLAGFTVTMAASGTEFVVRSGGALTMSDTSSGKSGLITSEQQAPTFRLASNASLTFDGGNYKKATGNIVSIGAQSTLTINGGTFETTGTASIAFNMNGTDAKLNINGGSFKAYDTIRANIQCVNGTINVTNFDASLGNLYVRYPGSLSEPFQISSILTLGNPDLMTADRDGKELDGVATGGYFRIAPAYEVNYDFNGGTSESLTNYRFPVPGNIPVPAWNTISPPEGKELSHWENNGEIYQEGSSINVTAKGSVTFKAIWQDQTQYTVNLYANNGTETKITSQEWSLYTLPTEIPDDWPVNTGYYFAGWAQTQDGEPLTGQVQLKGDTDFYAIYKRIPYEITYSAEGATSVPRTQTKHYNSRITLSNLIPKKTGYTFVGWLDPETETVYSPGDYYSENRPLALYAMWEVATYELSYVAEGATNVPESQTKTHDVMMKISEQKPRKDGYIFYGWAETEGGAVKYRAGADYNENTVKTLYAVWVQPEFAIIGYDANSKSADVVLPEAGTYMVIFADYDSERLANIECVPVTVSAADVAVVGITKEFTLDAGDKIMFWNSMTSLTPFCEAYIVE